MYAAIAPSHPTDEAMCTASIALRTRGGIVIRVHAWAVLAAAQQHHPDQQRNDNHEAGLSELACGPGAADERLHAGLSHYARICPYRARHGSADLSALLHRGTDVADAEERIHELFTQLLDEAAAGGGVRTDIAASELADYCLHAPSARRRRRQMSPRRPAWSS